MWAKTGSSTDYWTDGLNSLSPRSESWRKEFGSSTQTASTDIPPWLSKQKATFEECPQSMFEEGGRVRAQESG